MLHCILHCSTLTSSSEDHVATNIVFLALVRPQYILKDNYVLAQPGESPTLHFSVTSDPPLTENTTHVVAAKNGDVILRFKVQDNCITFRNVKTTDTGPYTISCRNARGLEGKAAFELDISESASELECCCFFINNCCVILLTMYPLSPLLYRSSCCLALTQA